MANSVGSYVFGLLSEMAQCPRLGSKRGGRCIENTQKTLKMYGKKEKDEEKKMG
jgi:hypothetical protein